MRIAVLSDPNNFHTQKWAGALAAAGADVIVFSYDYDQGSGLNTVRLQPPVGWAGGGYSYLDYLRGGQVLRQALEHHRVDLLNPLNITPFGVWARQSGFHPTLACAMGADILEYAPPGQPQLTEIGRLWQSTDLQPSPWRRWKDGTKQRFFRAQVDKALLFADHITGDNQWLVQAMQQWFNVPAAKLTTLPWGVEPEHFLATPGQLLALRKQFNLPPEARVVLSPRGAKPIYQSDIILQAFAQLLQTHDLQTHFVFLAAGYQSAPAIHEQALLLQHSHPNFHYFPEAIPRQTLHHLWNLVDVFVSAPVYDGYSAALAEGRYIGAIPIVNDIPATRELIQDGKNGVVCTPFDPDTLATRIQAVLANLHSLKPKFAEANRAWILQNSLLSTNVARFLLLAEKMLQARKG